MTDQGVNPFTAILDYMENLDDLRKRLVEEIVSVDPCRHEELLESLSITELRILRLEVRLEKLEARE